MRTTTPAVLTHPLHVLIVSSTETSTHVQGADRDVINMLNALGPARVRVTWAGIRNTKSLAAYLDDTLDVRYLDLNFKPFYDLVYRSIYRPRSIRNWAGIIRAQFNDSRAPVNSLRKELSQDRPDVVLTTSSVVLIGAAYARTEHLPHIWLVKEFLDPEVGACRKYAWLIERLSHAVVVPSAAMTRAFSKRVRVIKDGSDVASILRGASNVNRDEVLRSLNLPINQPVVAQIGVISFAKGQQVTVAAYRHLMEAGRQPHSLLFLGVADVREKKAVQHVLDGLPDRWKSSVRFLEFGPGDFSYPQIADIIVHPSTMPDPFPNAVREAMILGKPVIGSRVGGIPELITHNVTGILIPPNNEVELASALEKLLDSPQLRADMGVAGQRKALVEWDVAVCREAFYDLLLEVVSFSRDDHDEDSRIRRLFRRRSAAP
jgi:glycosyltransferase involved in cell wall biosynthesis